MDYASQQRNPARHPIGIGVVVLLHVVLGWALVNGLGRRVVEVIRAPVQTRIIEEPEPPPPPPPKNLPPPPKLAAPPPPPFVPPPEIQIATPPPPPITVTPEAPPPAPPVAIAPAPAPAPAPAAPAPPAPPAPAPAPAAPPAPKIQPVPARIDVSTCEKPDYPPAALRADATGTTKIRFTVDASGVVSKAEIERSAGPSREHRLLDRAAVDTLGKCRFKPGIDDKGKPVGSTAVVDYVWKTE